MSAQPLREEEPQPLEIVESPGKRLRIARQAKGMGHGDVASQLHLSVAIVKALENDEHERLAGPVFVRGYIRNYARLLGLDDKQLLGEARVQEPEERTRPKPAGGGVRPELRSSHLGVKLVSWLIVLVLIGLLVTWWQGHQETDVADTETPTEDPLPVASSEDGSLMLPQVDGQGDFTPPGDEAIEETAPAAVTAEQPEPYAPEAVVDTPEATQPPSLLNTEVDTGDSGVRTAESVTKPTAPAAVSVPLAVTPTVEQTAEDNPAAVPAGRVVFEFIGPCWVDIRDSTRKFKIFGEMNKGDIKVLEGTPPYSVILGNSPMVKVSVDGEPYSVEAHARGSVARFTLDPDNLNP